MPATTLTCMPDDLLLNVLLLSESLQDLHSQIQSHRRVLEVFTSRRTLITKSVILHQARNLSQVEDPGRRALNFIALIVKRLRHNVLDDSILAYEALEPIIANEPYVKSLTKWTVKLCRLYAKIGTPAAATRQLDLLERAYNQIVRPSKLNFHTEHEEPSSANLQLNRHWTRLCQNDQDLCRALAEEYASLRRLEDCRQIQMSVLQRLTLKDTDSEIWGGEIAKTWRALGDHERAVSYYRNMRTLCPDQSAALGWTRRIVAEKLSAGHIDEALDEQASVLRRVTGFGDEHIAWARQLVTLQKRAGRFDEALELKHAIWQRLGIQNSCFWGWTRELADDYRIARKCAEAFRVVHEMHIQTSGALRHHPKDAQLAYHAALSAQALEAERAYSDKMLGWGRIFYLPI